MPNPGEAKRVPRCQEENVKIAKQPMPALALAAFMTILALGTANAESINAGDHKPVAQNPFKATEVASFDTPWAIAVLPDTRLLVTTKPGHIFLVTEKGKKTEISHVPKVAASGQNGLLDIALSPGFVKNRQVYLTYVEQRKGGTGLALARADLAEKDGKAALANLAVIWRQKPAGGGGQPGGMIAFDPAGKHLFLTSGDRMTPKTAQDPGDTRGKILRLSLDGSTPKDNPYAAKGGVAAEVWTMGHRNQYGLAFAPDGKLWEHEMGPKGGDEFNLIEAGKNHGWPLVSNGDNYDGSPIPRHATRPDFAAPALYWTPVIAPAGLAFYEGKMFANWHGSALIGGLRSQALVRVKLDGKGGADEAERYAMGARIRDVAVAADGAVWLIEDAKAGRLLRLTPSKK
jgi:aldose sugar dehydrogenase